MPMPISTADLTNILLSVSETDMTSEAGKAISNFVIAADMDDGADGMVSHYLSEERLNYLASAQLSRVSGMTEKRLKLILAETKRLIPDIAELIRAEQINNSGPQLTNQRQPSDTRYMRLTIPTFTIGNKEHVPALNSAQIMNLYHLLSENKELTPIMAGRTSPNIITFDTLSPASGSAPILSAAISAAAASGYLALAITPQSWNPEIQLIKDKPPKKDGEFVVHIPIPKDSNALDGEQPTPAAEPKPNTSPLISVETSVAEADRCEEINRYLRAAIQTAWTISKPPPYFNISEVNNIHFNLITRTELLDKFDRLFSVLEAVVISRLINGKKPGDIVACVAGPGMFHTEISFLLQLGVKVIVREDSTHSTQLMNRRAMKNDSTLANAIASGQLIFSDYETAGTETPRYDIVIWPHPRLFGGFLAENQTFSSDDYQIFTDNLKPDAILIMQTDFREYTELITSHVEWETIYRKNNINNRDYLLPSDHTNTSSTLIIAKKKCR